MKKSYSTEEVQHWRDKVNRRGAKLPVVNERQALAFINKVGFCLAVRAEGLELPNLWDAIAGTRPHQSNGQGTRGERRSYFLSYAWEIQHILPNHNSVFYGKIFRRRPSLVSRNFLPFFYALSELTGARDEFKVEHAKGRLSASARSIMDILMKNDPLTAREVRDLLAGKGRREGANVERALEELQRKMFITRVVGNGHHVGARWAPLSRCFPQEVRKAQRISREQARSAILHKYFDNQLVSSIDAIHHVFGWARTDIYRAVGQLVHEGVITTTVVSDGRPGTQYCLVQ